MEQFIMITNMTTLSLNDGQSTPVAHSFSPASNGADGVCRWQDREHNDGISLGFSTVTYSVREPVKAGGVTRVKLTVSVPKLDTTATVPSLIGVGQASMEFIFPGAYTLQDRKNLHAFARNVTGSTALGENIVEMQRPY